METKSPTVENRFLGKITVPVHVCMMRGVVEYAGQLGDLLSFDDKELYSLKNTVEEAFCNAVEHFSGQVTKEDYIHIEFVISENALIISIMEKGIPFDRRNTGQYTPGSIDGMNNPGLGTILMQHGMDKVEHLIHGREGKETRLTKRLKPDTVPKEILDIGTPQEIPRNFLKSRAILRIAKPDDLNEVTRLAWRCYGFTQEAILYDLDSLTQKVINGEIISIVAIDPTTNDMIGHIALKHHDPDIKVPELGLAFTDPTYRNSGLALSLGRKALDIAKETGCLGMFDCSVTTHTFSQQGMQTLGSRPCGLFMGIAAAGMQAKALSTSNQDKGSVVNHYYAFERFEKTVYISEHHRKMVSEIYEWLELPRVFKKSEPTPLSGPSSISVFPLPEEHNAAFIIVHTIGGDTSLEVAKELRLCKQNRMDAIYVFLPVESSASPVLVEQFETIGLSFAGIMPHIHGGEDRMLMQCINILISPDDIRVHGPMTRKLLDYILNEQDRISPGL